jgi:hypothetical protein
MKPFEPDQIKTFRTPKYTGVTLSLLSIFVLASMIAVWDMMPTSSESPSDPLSVHCEKLIEKPIRATAAQFSKEFNIPIEIKVAPLKENTLIAQPHIKQNNKNFDLLISSQFISGNPDLNNEIFQESIPVANHVPVFATRDNFSLTVNNWSDILDQNLTIGLIEQNPGSSRKIKLPQTVIQELQNTDRLLFFPDAHSLNESLLNSDKLDAAIVWHQIARKMNLRVLQLDELQLKIMPVYAHVHSRSQKATKSIMFARYLAAPSKGQFHFANNHLIGVDGDRWAVEPVLNFYSEPSFKSSMTSKIEDFSKREGVTINFSFPEPEKLIFAISSISQSKTIHLLPDLLLVSRSTADRLPSTYKAIDHQQAESNNLFLFNSNSKYRTLATRFSVFEAQKL